MAILPQSTQVIRFGPFEVDLQSGELHKNGVRLKIQEQPFQVLLVLLEHQRQLVTRGELQHQLWPADTFVDFETGLNRSIAKLRELLGDSALTGLGPALHARLNGGRVTVAVKSGRTAQQGEKLEHDNQFQAALAKFRFAGSLLEELRKTRPDWQPAIVFHSQ